MYVDVCEKFLGSGIGRNTAGSMEAESDRRVVQIVLQLWRTVFGSAADSRNTNVLHSRKKDLIYANFREQSSTEI